MGSPLSDGQSGAEGSVVTGKHLLGTSGPEVQILSPRLSFHHLREKASLLTPEFIRRHEQRRLSAKFTLRMPRPYLL